MGWSEVSIEARTAVYQRGISGNTMEMVAWSSAPCLQKMAGKRNDNGTTVSTTVGTTDGTTVGTTVGQQTVQQKNKRKEQIIRTNFNKPSRQKSEKDIRQSLKNKQALDRLTKLYQESSV